jgi:hypothetical protein
VSGTASHGNSLTIMGSSFGSKNHAGPAIYDDFDDAAIDDIATPTGGREPQIHQGIFSSHNEWQYSVGGINAPNVVRSGSFPKALSTYHARSVFSSIDYFRLSVAVSGDNFDTGGERYISFYYRFRKTSAGHGRQTKAWVVFPNGSASDAAYWSTAFGICEVGGWRQHLAQTGSEQPSSIDGPEIDDEWVRFESYIKQSAANTANGAWHQTTYRPNLGMPAKEVLTWDNRTMRTSATNWEFWEFGGAFYDVCFPGDTATIDIDEFYMDSTRARVEICNAPTFSASTHCELQLPTAWSDTSITVEFTKGYLGPQAYVYVINAAGSVNSSGYPISVF